MSLPKDFNFYEELLLNAGLQFCERVTLFFSIELLS